MSEGRIDDSFVAHAEATFVRDEANFFRFIYPNRITSDAKAYQVGSDFVDKLRNEHPEVYDLGVKAGDLFNEAHHAIPSETRFQDVWNKFYRTHMKIDNADMRKRFQKSSEQKWMEAAQELAEDDQYRDVSVETWDKIVRFATSGDELKQRLRELNLEPKIK